MNGAKSIVIISSIDWSFNWQGPQEIATRLAKEGYCVFFIENTGVRIPNYKDLPRVKSRLKNWKNRNRNNLTIQVEENIHIFSPIVLPPFGSSLQRKINQHYFLPLIKKAAQNLGIEDPSILTFLPTDTAADLIKTFKTDKSHVMYYVAGDFDKLVKDEDKLRNSELEVVDLSDSVVTICDSLSDRYKNSNAEVKTIPYGVDLKAFLRGNKSKLAKFAKQISSSFTEETKHVIGYVGALHRHVDVELLEAAAKMKKDWSWVFVGPIHTNVTRLEKLSNLSFLGAKPHKELVYYIKNFDVCMIPYVNSPFTQTVVPVKLNEYLAVGKPVVATDIPLVRKFNEKYNVINICTNDAKEFTSTINDCLIKTDDQLTIENRKNVAQQSNWESKFENIHKIINGNVEERSVFPLPLKIKSKTQKAFSYEP